MALSALQRNVLRCIAANRSDTSYIAGGVALNRDWPRVSDDIDVFHDTDEEIGAAASADIETLRQAGFSVRIELEIYGIVEAVVSQGARSTIVQWMSESRTRFFPLVKDDAWGARLHQTDLAVNKVIAASSRTKARDFVDLVAISQNMCPLGPLLLAAAGKPPHFSPSRMIEEIRRRGHSVPTAEYDAVKGLRPGGQLRNRKQSPLFPTRLRPGLPGAEPRKRPRRRDPTAAASSPRRLPCRSPSGRDSAP